MVGGLAGPAAVAANQGLRGQQQNAAVQEWTRWKQWALDHKNFEAFSAERLDDWEKLNARLGSDEFSAEWSANTALGLKSDEESIQQQKILARVAIAGIVFLVP